MDLHYGEIKYENSTKSYVQRCDNTLKIAVTISSAKHWWLILYP